VNDIETTHYFDAKENRDVFERVQDCEPVLLEAKQHRDRTDGRGDTSLGYFVGTIPGIIVEQYLKTAGVTYREFMIDRTHIHRIMNNPDYKKFRVFEGNIGKG